MGSFLLKVSKSCFEFLQIMSLLTGILCEDLLETVTLPYEVVPNSRIAIFLHSSFLCSSTWLNSHNQLCVVVHPGISNRPFHWQPYKEQRCSLPWIGYVWWLNSKAPNVYVEIEEYIWSAFLSVVGSLSVAIVIKMMTIAVLCSRHTGMVFPASRNLII